MSPPCALTTCVIASNCWRLRSVSSAITVMRMRSTTRSLGRRSFGFETLAMTRNGSDLSFELILLARLARNASHKGQRCVRDRGEARLFVEQPPCDRCRRSASFGIGRSVRGSTSTNGRETPGACSRSAASASLDKSSSGCWIARSLLREMLVTRSKKPAWIGLVEGDNRPIGRFA